MLPAKRRSVEKRREISRCAARHRREKEADVFTDLYVTVPIVEEPKVTHVDRIAVLRLAASLCRFRQVAGKVLTPNSLQNVEIDNKIERDLLSDLFSETMLGDSLNGFLLVVDSRSSIIYISPNVSRSLGLTQTDLVGQCLNDFLHQEDVAELKQNFADVENGSVGKMFLRMKSVLGARGRNLNLRSALYKAVSFVMTKRQIDNIGNAAARKAAKEINIESDDNDMDDDDENSLMSNEGNASCPKTKSVDNNYFFLHGSLISQYGSVETHSAGAFVTRHSMEMKFSYCHDRLSDYLGYDIKSLMGVSFYSLVHPQDISQLNNDFKELYKKGQVSSGIYRLMAKSGGYVWLTTEASIVTQGTRSGRGQHIVCVHQVISAPEATEILADVQQNVYVHCAAPTKAESNRKTVMAPKHEIGGSTCDGLVERAPNVTEITTLPNVPIRNHDNFVGSNYESWLFRGWPNAQHASTTNGSLEECRSKSSFSSNSIAEDTNSPDRSPPLLIVGNESQAYNSQYHTFGFGEGRTDDLSAERTPMLIPADSLGAGGAQPGRNTNMYTTLLDADLSSAEDLTDKLVDLSLLAPFVDTGELVTLDLLAEDLDVPLDFGDFSDLSLDTFTEETKAKFTASNGGKLGKTDSDPSLASCQLGFNVGGQKYHDQFMGYNTVGGKDLDWPQIIESLSPMTSSHSEVVHQVYRVAIEHPTSNGERAQALKNEQNFGHYNKTTATGCGYKNDTSLNGVATKIHPYINDNLFGFAHDAALSNKVPNVDKLSGGVLHQNHQQQTNFALSHVAQTSGQHEQQNWNHHHQSYKGMPNLHSSHETLEPLNSHNYAQQSHQLTKAKSVVGFAGIHGHSRNDADAFQHQNGTNFQPHLVQGSHHHHHQYKCSTPVFDFERTAQTNSGASNGLKALSSFTHSPANYPQRQPTAPPGMWLPQHIYNSHHASQNFAHGRKCGTAPQTPTQTSSDGLQFQWDVQPVTPDRLRSDAHPKIVDCAPFLLPGAKVNHQGKTTGTGSSNMKKRLRSDSTFPYSNHHTIGKASDVASPLYGQQFYMNPNVRVNNPPPLVSSNFPWNHNPGSIMMVPNSPLAIVDPPTTSEPKIKRLKTSAHRQGYIKIETPFVQGQHHLATHI